uniref:Uncharacterized protein n=1 Tax=Anguilla anguilla TaxID=7936 RepID=A0A0E9RHC9_ANGAN
MSNAIFTYNTLNNLGDAEQTRGCSTRGEMGTDSDRLGSRISVDVTGCRDFSASHA